MRRSMQRGWLAVCLVVAGVGALPMLPAVANGPDEVGSRLRRLEDLEKIKAAVPDDVLVLPAHNEPFRGLHARLDHLAHGHHRSLARLLKSLDKP